MAYVNMVVDDGLAIISNRIKGQGTEPKYIAWGVGTAETTAADAALGSASAEARTSGTSSITNAGGTTDDTYQVVGTITCTGSSKAITEAGLFDANTAGNMFVRSNFAAINVDVGDSIEFTFKVIGNQS